MGQGKLTIYSASAGSGKTFTLAGNYLSGLFRSRYSYRKILAVTFTNKATAEMKNRILEHLNSLASGKESACLPMLIRETGMNETEIRKEASGILNSILHDFSRFSVCTIDTFFQKIIRSFARESNIYSGYAVELDHDVILSEAVDRMIADSVNNVETREWLKEQVMSNLEEGKTWNLKNEILKLSEELFRENFKMLSRDEQSKLGNKSFLLGYISQLKTITSTFTRKLSELGGKCLSIYNEYGLADDMFYQRSRGVPGYIRSIAAGNPATPNSYVREIMNDPPRWARGDCPGCLSEALSNGLEDTLKEAIRYHDGNIIRFNSANAVLPLVYSLGILSDVSAKIREIASAENKFLISDAAEFLGRITGGDQAPFIYEKIGNRYDNYMIDEFQDTSAMQWNNFIPLVNDSMGGGNDNLVVGDVKQSIYRFRNSKWQILADMQERLVDNERFLRVPLITNFRSRSGIIRFNNALFSVLPALFEKSLPDVDGIPGFTSIYSEAVQDDPGRKEGGFVRLEFVEAPADETGGTRTAASGRKWRESVLEKLPGVLESFQENGYKASDIGILVRESKDGADVLKAIARYADNVPPDLRKKYNYNVVSNDSLTLSNSPAVKFLIATLNVMIDGSDLISRARMLRFFLMSKGDENAESAPLYGDTLLDKNNTYFPAGYPDFLERVSLMPLFEITENIISFFGLGDYPAHVPYLFAFQDLILNFSGRRSHGIQSFLDWWETTGKYKSVVLSPGVDAAMVYTIHKSKGLEFKVVIIPFMSWNLDHKTRHQPILWIKPDTRPFSASGIVPVRYKKDLEETIFADSYAREKVSSYLDNLNLLYVAMTRAIDAIWGFLPDEPGKTDSMAGKVKEALVTGNSETGEQEAFLAKHYNSDTRVFEMGTIPRVNSAFTGDPAMECHNYAVSRKPASLRLKLHGENYFARGSDAVRQKINRGNILHEIFAGINTSDDTRLALSRLVIEGKLSEDESASLALRLETLISGEPVSGWFKPGNIVMVEAVILLPRGQVRRPDRVIIEGNSATLIDFKTGVEVNHHLDQMNEYLSLLDEMGFKNTKAFLWYIDINKIVRVA